MKRLLMIIGGVVLTVCAVAGLGVIMMWLWNAIVPEVFAGLGITSIGFWQALGLLVLGRLLFGGFGHHNYHRKKTHANLFREKWAKMTPEEQKDFMKKCHFRFRHFHARHFGCDVSNSQTTEKPEESDKQE
jgi:predicted Fe-S protein YdhL (DUF1289 family)